MKKRRMPNLEQSRAPESSTEPTWVELDEGTRLLGKPGAKTFLYNRVAAGRIRNKSAPLGRAHRRRLYAREDIEALLAEYKPRPSPGKALAKAKKKSLVKVGKRRGRKSEIEKINAALTEVNGSRTASLADDASRFFAHLMARHPEVVQISFDMRTRKALVLKEEKINLGGLE